MTTDVEFEWLDEERGFARCKLTGAFSMSDGVARVTQAIAGATARGYLGLVVDIRGIEGIEPPDVAARHAFVRGWAGVAGPNLRVAMVARPEFIDPEKFGLVVARNFGMDANIFDTQAEALYWLRSDTILDP